MTMWRMVLGRFLTSLLGLCFDSVDIFILFKAGRCTADWSSSCNFVLPFQIPLTSRAFRMFLSLLLPEDVVSLVSTVRAGNLVGMCIRVVSRALDTTFALLSCRTESTCWLLLQKLGENGTEAFDVGHMG